MKTRACLTVDRLLPPRPVDDAEAANRTRDTRIMIQRVGTDYRP